MAKSIILGNGLFYIGETAVGLTRGGGQFTVERTFRDINADGDMGSVVERVTLDEARPKLTMKLLEIIVNNLPSYYAGTKITSTKWHGKNAIESSDFLAEVSWVGKTQDGKNVKIALKNALCKENIDFSLEDKGEVVPSITFEGCYTDGSSEQPWEVTFTS